MGTGRSKIVSMAEAAGLIPDGATVSVSSSSGLGCPDAMLRAIGERFRETGSPRNLTTIHPIAAGDMYGIDGIDHIAEPGLLKRVIAGSFPVGSVLDAVAEDLADDPREPDRGLQHPERHSLPHAPRRGGQAARRPDARSASTPSSIRGGTAAA